MWGYVRRIIVDPSDLNFSLSLHRHSLMTCISIEIFLCFTWTRGELHQDLFLFWVLLLKCVYKSRPSSLSLHSLTGLPSFLRLSRNNKIFGFEPFFHFVSISVVTSVRQHVVTELEKSAKPKNQEGIPHGPTRVLHTQLCSEFTTHWSFSLVIKFVPGIVSGTKRDCTWTPRVVVQWIHCTTSRGVWYPWNQGTRFP